MATEKASRIDPVGIVVAVMLIATAGIVYWNATTLQITSPYDIGPKVMSFLVACGLVLIAIPNLVLAFREGSPGRETLDPKAIALILAGQAALIALIGYGGGFIIATAILFATTSAAFGRRAFLLDLAIGFGLGLAIYLMFDKLLTLSLPAGPLERLI